MTAKRPYRVHLSAVCAVDVADGESAPAGFRRRQHWPQNRYGFRTRVVTIEESDSEELARRFEVEVRRLSLTFRSEAGVVEALKDESVRVWLHISFGPGTGSIRLPEAFISEWGSLGGSVEIDTPLRR